MDEQHSGRLLHGLDKHTNLGSHWRVGKLERIEVHHGIENAVGCGWSAADENRQTVQGSIYYEGIAVSRMAQLVDCRGQHSPRLAHTCCCPGEQQASCPGVPLPQLQVV